MGDETKMVRQQNDLFQCSECKLFYRNHETAQQCEEWCAKTKSCNLEIIKHAVKK